MADDFKQRRSELRQEALGCITLVYAPFLFLSGVGTYLYASDCLRGNGGVGYALTLVFCAGMFAVLAIGFVANLVDFMTTRIVPRLDGKTNPSKRPRYTSEHGRALARSWAELEAIAHACGLAPLSTFRGETMCWHVPADGLRAIDGMMTAIRERTVPVSRAAELLLDLEMLRRELALADTDDGRFCLRIRIG